MLGFLPLSSRAISGLRILENPAIPVTDTHDGAYDYLRKRAEKQARLRREQEEKDRKANNIRQQIEDVLYPPDIKPDEETGPIRDEKTQEKPQNVVFVRDFLAELANLESQMFALHAQEVQMQKDLRRQKDEEDMKIILRLLQ